MRHGTDKNSTYHNYLQHYEKELYDRRKESITLLEIGVHTGASLRTWQEYFINGSITGVDIDPACLSHAAERTKIILANQSNNDDLQRLASLGPWDFIIDDGSHVWDDQIMSFQTLFPSISCNGLYIIEDMQTSYGMHTAKYSGTGITRTSEFVHTLADWVCGNQMLSNVSPPSAIGKIWQLVESIKIIRGAAIIRRNNMKVAHFLNDR